MTFNNPIFDELCQLGVCNPDTVTKLHPRVRDRDDIDVLQCAQSGVIFLSETQHIDISHYEAKAPTHRPGAGKRAIISTNDDTERRFSAYGNIVRGKRWLDIGAGSGAVLDRFGPVALEYAGVEPQETAASFLKDLGHPVYRSLEEVPQGSFDVITLFHVFEHLQSPMDMLQQAHDKLAPGGRIIIEVPHARDFLISFVACPEFRDHTFWSEHLVLHTRASLNALLCAAGFQVTAVTGVHRYPLANALHWLAKGKAGGHEHWSMLRDTALDQAWGDVLARQDMTDTLVADARRI